MKVFIPRDLVIDTKRLARAIENTLTASAKAVQVDLQVTTQTWKHKPDFPIDVEPGKRTIATDDEIYGYVDEGTRPHIITARGAKPLTFGVGGSPKTTPKVIGSRPGAKGSTIVRARTVHHPGTDAREFTDEIKKKWDQELPVQFQRMIDSEA